MADVTAKKFKNWTDEPFKWKWDGVEYSFPAGSETYLEDYKAEHFAKHLTDREMTKANVPVDRLVPRAEFLEKCFPLADVVTPAEALDRNEKAKVDAPVEEFPDLNSNVPKVKAKKIK